MFALVLALSGAVLALDIDPGGITDISRG